MNSFSENSETYLSCEFKDNLTILREINFFSQLPMETLKILAYLFKREMFKKDDYLFRQHEDAGHAMYIICGQAELTRKKDEQEEKIREYNEGDFLGGLNLLGNIQHLYSLKAQTDLTCLIMTREKFTQAMDQFPDLKPKVIQALIDRIRIWENTFLKDRDENCTLCRNKLGVSMI